jgi:hypothetical protein
VEVTRKRKVDMVVTVPTNHDDVDEKLLQELMLLSWVAYLSPHPRVIDAHARSFYFDVQPKCPFAQNLSLADTLEGGFQGMMEPMKLIKFFSSDQVR